MKTGSSAHCLYNNMIFQVGTGNDETRCLHYCHSRLKFSEGEGDLVKDYDL